MKTQIISLQSHDDLVSVRDRMSWAKSPRILLVWPRFERITLRPLDLRLLQHHAAGLGADLGLVTRSRSVRRVAEGFDIPVFRTAAKAQRDAWPGHISRRVVRRRKPVRPAAELSALRRSLRPTGSTWTSNILARIAFFLVGVLAVLALAALFVPRVDIVLSPVTQTQEISLPAEAGLSEPSGVVTLSLAARPLRVAVSATQSARITSRAAVPLATAQGIAHFENLTLTPLVVPAGTVIYGVGPAGVRYSTLSESRLDGEVGAAADIPIRALDAGEVGNAPANTIQGIEGDLALSASVTNPDPVTGGADRSAIVASEADRQELRSQLLRTLDDRALSKLQTMVSGGDLLLPDTVRLEKVVAEAFDPQPGHAGDSLTLSMSADFDAQFVSGDDLHRFAEASLNSSLPQGFRPLPETLQVRVADTPIADGQGRSRFTLDSSWTIARDIDTGQANMLVRGLSPAAAARRLETAFPLVRAPQIGLRPAWWPWLPLIPIRIAVSVQ
jgi:hypothetical protein